MEKNKIKCCNVWCPNNSCNGYEYVCRSSLEEAVCTEDICEYSSGHASKPETMLEYLNKGAGNMDDVLNRVMADEKYIIKVSHMASIVPIDVNNIINDAITEKYPQTIVEVNKLLVSTADDIPWHSVWKESPKCDNDVKSTSTFLVKRNDGTIQVAFYSIAGFCSNYSFYDEFMLYDVVSWIEIK